MQVAKATKEEIAAAREFLQACEQVMERGRSMFSDPLNEWKRWDDDDEEKKVLLNIRKNVADEEDLTEDEVDMRIVMYEYLRSKYPFRWMVVLVNVAVLIDSCCDPTEDVLAYYPGTELLHVANEM